MMRPISNFKYTHTESFKRIPPEKMFSFDEKINNNVRINFKLD
jgi:hypothetical protein